MEKTRKERGNPHDRDAASQILHRHRARAEHHAGDIYVGFGESPAVAMLMDVYGEIQREHPDIHLRIYSGNAESILERIRARLGKDIDR